MTGPAKLVSLADKYDAFNFYVDQRIEWPPRSRWRRFVRWFRRVVLRRRDPVYVVTRVDPALGVIEMYLR